MKKYIILLSCVLVIGLCVIGCSKTRTVSQVNKIAQDFALDNLDGNKIYLSDFKDKTNILLVFWATWCPYCVEEIPALNKISEENKDNLKILGIDIKEDLKKVTDFSKKKGLKYTVLLDSDGSIAQKYKVLGIPTNVLIDKEGKIRYTGHSLDECKRILSSL